jgi:hypothetical protein
LVRTGETSGQFSFSFQGSTGEFYLDGWNREKTDGNFVWLDLKLEGKEEPGLWKVEVDSFKIGDDIILGHRSVIVDTGRSLEVMYLEVLFASVGLIVEWLPRKQLCRGPCC